VPAVGRRRSEPPGALAFFEKEVRPLLIEQCSKCHGPKKQEAGLRVDFRSALLKGGESGPAIGLNSPRISVGASVLRSHMSCVAAPPSR